MGSAAVLIAALAAGAGRDVLGKGVSDGGLGQDPRGIDEGYWEIALLKDQGDLGAAGEDGLNRQLLQVFRRLQDQASRRLLGIPAFDGIDGLHDTSGLDPGLGRDQCDTSGLEIPFKQAGLQGAGGRQKTEAADVGMPSQDGRYGLADQVKDGDAYGPLKSIIIMMGGDARDGEKFGTSLNQDVGTGDKDGEGIGPLAPDGGCPVRDLRIAENQNLQMVLIGLDRSGSDDFLVEISSGCGSHPAENPDNLGRCHETSSIIR